MKMKDPRFFESANMQLQVDQKKSDNIYYTYWLQSQT